MPYLHINYCFLVAAIYKSCSNPICYCCSCLFYLEYPSINSDCTYFNRDCYCYYWLSCSTYIHIHKLLRVYTVLDIILLWIVSGSSRFFYLENPSLTSCCRCSTWLVYSIPIARQWLLSKVKERFHRELTVPFAFLYLISSSCIFIFSCILFFFSHAFLLV